ncbi:MAG: substrate-binding periplasmic protein [Pseudomonadales bacterium]
MSSTSSLANVQKLPRELRVLVNTSPLSTACEKVVEAAFSLLDIRLVRMPMPPNRAIKTATDGSADGIICRIDEFAQHYPEMLRISPQIFALRAHVISKNLPIEVTKNSWANLSPYFIAIINGHLYSTRATQHFPKVHRLPNTAKAMDLITRNRIDAAVLVSINIIRELTFNPKYRDITMSQEPIADIPLHFYLHKKHASIVKPLSSAFAEVHSSGLAEELYQQVYRSQMNP